MAGPISDKFGGAIVTHWSGIGLLICAIAVTFYTHPTSMEQFPLFVGLMLGMFFFSGVGNASTFKQMPMIFEPRQAGGIIGWTAAMASFGPFIFGMLIGWSFSATGSPSSTYMGWRCSISSIFILTGGTTRAKGAEKPC